MIIETSDDITDCGVACDTYLNQSALAKVAKGSIWDKTLVDFVGRFKGKRERFHFIISVHIHRTTETSAEKLKDFEGKMEKGLEKVEEKVEEFAEKYVFTMLIRKTRLISFCSLMKHFGKLWNPLEKKLAHVMEDLGGKEAALNDDDHIRALHDIQSKHDSHSDKLSYAHTVKFKHVKKELQDDPEKAIQDNRKEFERKLEMQKHEIVEAMKKLTAPPSKVLHPVSLAFWPECLSYRHISNFQHIDALWTTMVSHSLIISVGPC